jgi:hypothetical protein
VVAVVIDVGRQHKRVAATHDPLLAEIGRTPIDFQPQLVSFHDLWRLGESFTKLGEEGDVPVRGGLVVDEAGVRELAGPAVRCTLDQSARPRIVPRLRVEPSGRGERDEKEWGSEIHSGKLVADQVWGEQLQAKRAQDGQ